jgi:hypothetical protein
MQRSAPVAVEARQNWNVVKYTVSNTRENLYEEKRNGRNYRVNGRVFRFSISVRKFTI